MSILVVSENSNKELKSTTLNCITAARKISDEIHLIVIGNQCEEVVKQAALVENVKKVLHLDDPKYENPIAENIASVVVNISESYTHIITPASTFGKNFMPRVAALLDLSQISDVIKIENEDTFVRPIYAGNAFATIQSTDRKKIITIRSTSFDLALTKGGKAEIEKISVNGDQSKVEFVSREESKSDRPELGTARIVISGGRGLQSSENFSMLNEIADKLKAAVGASRAAVDAGYVSNDYQVGQTGKVVVPDLYIAVGISGAIQHLAGMKESKVIVAINKDEEAPIFNVADYGLNADLFEALPQLSAELDKLNTIQK
jgi:electron transfer flavoprotein alpha subunit